MKNKKILTTILIVLFFASLGVIEYLATAKVSIKADVLSWDKANHFMAFLVLYLMLSLTFVKLSERVKVLIMFLFGVQIEIVQYFLPYRDFSLLDLVADSIGIGLGVLVYKICFKKYITKAM